MQLPVGDSIIRIPEKLLWVSSSCYLRVLAQHEKNCKTNLCHTVKGKELCLFKLQIASHKLCWVTENLKMQKKLDVSWLSNIAVKKKKTATLSV